MIQGGDTNLILQEFQPDLQWKEDLSRNVKKIAVLRANTLGDFIFALPALQSLRESYSKAEIVLLGREWHADFLKDRPGPVDRVVVVPPVRGVNNPPDHDDDPRLVQSFLEQMEGEHFDLAIQVHGNGRFSNPFIRRLGAGLTVGSKNQDAAPLDLWVPFTATQPEILRHLEVISLISAHAGVVEPNLQVTQEDLELAGSFIVPGNKPVVALYPGGSDTRQRWPVEKFAAIGNSLSSMGAKVMMIGGPEDAEIAERIRTSMTAEVDNTCGKLSLRALVGFLSRCSLVIANNSDILRLAWAVDAPTVGLFWFGSFLSTGPLNRTIHRPVVSWRANCPICGTDAIQSGCEHVASFMDDITTVEVLASALDLLAKSIPKGAAGLTTKSTPKLITSRRNRNNVKGEKE